MKPKLKYRLIEQCAAKYSIDAMCKFYGISRSGYYRYKQNKGIPSKDIPLVKMIAECQSTPEKIHGYRYIQLWLESVSRRGNPYDNAVTENFFSLLKTECISRQEIYTF